MTVKEFPMLASVDPQTAVELLQVEHSAVRELIDALDDDEMTRPDTIRYGLYPDQKCSFKDLLAHLITYEAYALEAVDAWQRGQKHWISDAMTDPGRSREVHFGGIADRRDCTLAEVLAEWEQTQMDVKATIAGFSETEWRTSAPYPVAGETDLGGMLEAILVSPPRPMYRHLPVHVPDSEAYIRSLRQG
jgi:hypothetical protein